MDQRKQFYQNALDDIRSIPRVASAGWITFLPPETRAGVFMGLTLEGAAPPASGGPARIANHMISSTGYFPTMGTPPGARSRFYSGRQYERPTRDHRE